MLTGYILTKKLGDGSSAEFSVPPRIATCVQAARRCWHHRDKEAVVAITLEFLGGTLRQLQAEMRTVRQS